MKLQLLVTVWNPSIPDRQVEIPIQLHDADYAEVESRQEFWNSVQPGEIQTRLFAGLQLMGLRIREVD